MLLSRKWAFVLTICAFSSGLGSLSRDYDVYSERLILPTTINAHTHISDTSCQASEGCKGASAL